MNKYNPDKLSQHSKVVRLRNMISIRANNQRNNIYQTEHKSHVRYPQKRERRTINEEMYLKPPVTGKPSEDFIIG